MHQLWQNVQADEFLSQWKPFNSDELHPRFIPLSFCTSWYQWGALQGSSTWHSGLAQCPGHSGMGTVSWAQCPGHWNFGPQHPSPTRIVLPTWLLLDLWLIKSQECQMSVWELSSLSLTLHCSNMERQDFQILKSSWWDLFTILMSRSLFPAWTDLHVTGSADLMGSLSSTSPLWKNEALLPEPSLFALRIPACLDCC